MAPLNAQPIQRSQQPNPGNFLQGVEINNQYQRSNLQQNYPYQAPLQIQTRQAAQPPWGFPQGAANYNHYQPNNQNQNHQFQAPQQGNDQGQGSQYQGRQRQNSDKGQRTQGYGGSYQNHNLLMKISKFKQTNFQREKRYKVPIRVYETN